jgi:hydrogenase expression/formation protein HypE
MSDEGLPSCPLPSDGNREVVTLAHGEGARLSRQFIRSRLLTRLGNRWLDELGDAAQLPACENELVLTTDSFVVSPRFFPGGNIGTLAVYGTVNDLAVSGAVPRWLTLSMIIEEGFPFAELDTLLDSIAEAALRTGVSIVSGDTKVVSRGAADGLFLNTAGVGELVAPAPPGPASLQEGDRLIVSGPVAQHGMAIMTIREGFDFDPVPASDCAPLADAVAALRNAGVALRCLRDATRGGVAAVLHEWAESRRFTLTVEEAQIPVSHEVRGACELLGLDPIHVACEGTMLLAVPPDQAEAAINALRSVPETRRAVDIGEVTQQTISPVTIRRAGQELPLDEQSGVPLPRIC